MLEHAKEYNGDASKRFIMGGSAGGNLTTAVGLKYASHTGLKPSGLIIACPFACDLRAYPEEYKKRYTPEKYVDSPVLTREVMSWSTGKSNNFQPPHLIVHADVPQNNTAHHPPIHSDVLCYFIQTSNRSHRHT